MKKFFIILFLLLFFALFSSAAITNLKIPSSIHAGEYLKISGDYNEANVWCSFFIYDLNGYLVDRATDEQTNEYGKFVSNMLQINEPPFFRGEDYNVIVTCDVDTNSVDFSVIMNRTMENQIFYFWKWLVDSGNVIPAAMLLFVGSLMFGAVGIVWFSFKQGGRR